MMVNHNSSSGGGELSLHKQQLRAEARVFGARIQRLMDDRGWNQSELSRRSGVGRDMISGYVRGMHRPNPPHAKSIAEAFGIPVADLFPKSSDPGPEIVAAREAPPLEMRTVAPGRVMLHVNLELPLAVAVQVLGLVQGADASAL